MSHITSSTKYESQCNIYTQRQQQCTNHNKNIEPANERRMVQINLKWRVQKHVIVYGCSWLCVCVCMFSRSLQCITKSSIKKRRWTFILVTWPYVFFSVLRCLPNLMNLVNARKTGDKYVIIQRKGLQSNFQLTQYY